MMTHKNIDWEYEVEKIAQHIYCCKYCSLNYMDVKSIAEEEVFYYMEHEKDSLREVWVRVRFRVKHKFTFIREIGRWENWREDWTFIKFYDRVYGKK